MVVDAVVGVIDREKLPDLLTVIHRSGLGPQARVLDPARASVVSQLLRAGVIDPPAFTLDEDRDTVLLVFSTGRMALVTDALLQFGGRDICTLGRTSTFAAPMKDQPVTARRGMRRPYRPGREVGIPT